LHAVYSVSVNEGRGIYYVRSDDDGASWHLPGQVFDAVEAGWSGADTPRLAVDAQGGLHVVWVRVAPSPDPASEGLYYAYSDDDGETWSEPLEAAEGAYAWPRIEVSGSGQVHLLWNESLDGGTWHRWAASVSDALAEHGEGWTRTERVPGFEGVLGPVGLAADGAGVLHLVGLGKDELGEPVLLYATWERPAESAVGGEQWTKREAWQLDAQPSEPGIEVALQPALGYLSAVLRTQVRGGAEQPLLELRYTERTIPPVVVPMPTAAPAATATLPVATPPVSQTMELTPTATPDLMAGPPPAGGNTSGLSLALLLGGGLPLLIVAGVFGMRLLRSRRR
jgi:hypothetical protein